MTTAELEAAAQVMFERLEGWDTSVLETIGGRIKKAGRISATDAKAIENIRNITGDADSLITQLAQITSKNMADMNQIYTQLIADKHAEMAGLYDMRNIPYLPFEKNAALQGIVESMAKTTAGTMLNFSRTKALGFMSPTRFTPFKGAFEQAIGKAVLQISSGAVGFDTAMRDTIKQLGGSGVRTQYDTLTRRLDTVIRQNLLWGAKQTYTHYNDRLAADIGADAFEVDYHAGPRPSHLFMGGVMFRVGTPEAAMAKARLGDYGCLHFATPCIWGVSEPTYSPQQLASMKANDEQSLEYNGVKKTGYGWKQKQRQLETDIRRQKDVANMAKASGDDWLRRETQANINKLTAKYNELSCITGRLPLSERKSVSGFHRVKTNNELLTTRLSGATIKLPDGTVSMLSSGTQITDYEVFAGKGSPTELRVKEHLTNNYGGSADNWQHSKARAFVDVNGTPTKAMLHWFEEENVGVVEVDIKGWSKK